MKSDFSTPFSLTDARRKIEETDRELLRLFAERMAVCDGIGLYKAEQGLPIYDPRREEALVRSAVEKYPSLAPEIERLYEAVLSASRLRQTAENGRKYAVIGHPVAHSRSPELHGMLGAFPYETLDVLPDQLKETLRDPAYGGFNVTVPYKETVIPFLDRLTPEADAVGAVNTVRREADGTLTGHLTDTDGFTFLLDTVLPEANGKNAVVLGDGGTAKVIRFVLAKRGVRTVTVSRRAGNGEKKDYPVVGYAELQKVAASADLLVNATPVGMWPDEEKSPCDLSLFPRLSAVIDVVYRPVRTALLCQAKARGIRSVGGLPMLVRQGVRSFEFFHGVRVPALTESRIIRNLLRKRPYVFVGLPAVGKTTVGRLFAEKAGLRFLDTDEAFFRVHGVPPADCILSEGESAFREKEEAVVLSALSDASADGAVVSLGGGSLLSEKVRGAVLRNGLCVYLTADPAVLTAENRPLSQKDGIFRLAAERGPLYKEAADVTVDRLSSPEDTATAVSEAVARFLLSENPLL